MLSSRSDGAYDDWMRSSFAANVLVASVVALGAVAFSSCGSVTPASDGGAGGAAGSGRGGTTGAAGIGGTTGVAGTTGTAGNGSGGGGGTANAGGRGGGSADGGVLTCRTDVANDCPQGFTCACGGAGPGMCTCHKNCTDTSQCGTAEPMCGCAGATTGTARYCVNACFCTCR
jgi:hypothetical protein